MKDMASGSCLCGAVRFRIQGLFDHFFLCHCSRCRKDTGAAHAANLFSDTARILWLKGQDNVRMFRLPQTRHVKSFCVTCGSALPSLITPSGPLMVPAGSLDSPVSIRPAAHICFASRADWTDSIDKAPRYAGLPDMPKG
ncbi:GFA family protein [Paracoccus jiaweipingae]|uniref:GFA family protein n=1 Tax=unclassified Paracoccus (in: a-proteobacteria) TaxID=2688777 RepID=UPI0037B9CCD7